MGSGLWGRMGKTRPGRGFFPGHGFLQRDLQRTPSGNAGANEPRARRRLSVLCAAQGSWMRLAYPDGKEDHAGRPGAGGRWTTRQAFAVRRGMHMGNDGMLSAQRKMPSGQQKMPSGQRSITMPCPRAHGGPLACDALYICFQGVSARFALSREPMSMPPGSEWGNILFGSPGKRGTFSRIHEKPLRQDGRVRRIHE
jgi:hypothetical protein